ncbi:hypothetical protein GCM10010532_108410 [Dactylosporangium siamense]|uniref:Uncharacterized protein n=1 Tax=Dactylosporangium siamense TaxID=685454 RepID=A0A919PGR1_9ACTN|nr:hypothetical protein Dsi01nite_025770 [Dactylosporangium siamense]
MDSVRSSCGWIARCPFPEAHQPGIDQRACGPVASGSGGTRGQERMVAGVVAHDLLNPLTTIDGWRCRRGCGYARFDERG